MALEKTLPFLYKIFDLFKSELLGSLRQTFTHFSVSLQIQNMSLGPGHPQKNI